MINDMISFVTFDYNIEKVQHFHYALESAEK